jgi:adenylate kinase family enzyme
VVEPEIVLALDAPEGVLVKRLKEKGRKNVSDEGILRVVEASKKDVDPLVEYYIKRHKLQRIPCDDTSEGAPTRVKFELIEAMYAQVMVTIQNIIEGWYYHYSGGLT